MGPLTPGAQPTTPQAIPHLQNGGALHASVTSVEQQAQHRLAFISIVKPEKKDMRRGSVRRLGADVLGASQKKVKEPGSSFREKKFGRSRRSSAKLAWHSIFEHLMCTTLQGLSLSSHTPAGLPSARRPLGIHMPAVTAQDQACSPCVAWYVGMAVIGRLNQCFPVHMHAGMGSATTNVGKGPQISGCMLSWGG